MAGASSPFVPIPVCRLARDDIIELEFEEFVDEIRVKSFFPLDRLRAYLTDAKCKEILSCRCPKCVSDRNIFNNLDTDKFVPLIAGRDRGARVTNPAHGLFALLIYIEHPLLIIGFLDGNCSDDHLENAASNPLTFSRGSLEHYTDSYNKLNPQAFKNFAREFTNALPRFAIPHMDSSKFSKYADSTVLPFVDEKEIGTKMDEQGHWTSEGANGRVFQFRIPDEYRKFKFPKGKKVEWFARKKIETPEFMAYMEKEHVSYAQRFDDKHIVTLVKAYRIGNSINLIFPRAKANLNHLLRDSVLEYQNARRGPLESCEAWGQLRGIAMALARIQGFEEPNNDENHDFSQRLCIHFDLKPDNILVDDDDTWVITDFGQAAITHAKSGRTPRVANRQGTDAYAPPEIDVLDVQTGRRYDVWSLGCIFLEVTAFVVLGYAGLRGSNAPEDPFTGLDQARRAKPAFSNRSDERFFYRESQNGPCVVKSEIKAFINFLTARVEANSENSQKSKAFFAKIIHLINQMLEPNVESRIDIVEVIRTLSAAIKQASSGAAFVGDSEMVAANGETVIGGPELNSISLWHKTERTNEWDAANLELFENLAGYMRLHVWTNTQRPADVNFLRKHAKIVPLYAFWQQSQLASITWIKLLGLSSDVPAEIPNTKFSFSGTNNLKDARMVQSKLTSQQIVGSFALASVKLKKYVSVAEKVTNGVLRKLGASKADEKAKELVCNMPLGGATIQLWIEYRDAAAEKRRNRLTGSLRSTESSRGVRIEGGYSEIPPRRVVIYLHQMGFVCTIKMDVNWVLGEDPEDELVLYFEPNQPGKDPQFVACWLRPTPEEQEAKYPAGVPLNPEVLQLAEDDDRFEAEAFTLHFLTPTARNEFKAKYTEVKKEWDLMRRQIEKTEVYMPVNRRPLRFSHSRHGCLADLFPEHKAKFPELLAHPMEPEADPPTPNLDKGKGKAEDVDQPRIQGASNVRKTNISSTDYLDVPVDKDYGQSLENEKIRWVAGRGPRSGPPMKKGRKKRTESVPVPAAEPHRRSLL